MTTNKRTRKSTAIASAQSRAVAATQSYVPTAKEHAVVPAIIDRMQQAAPHARAKVEVKGDCAHLSWDHSNQIVGTLLWANALGTTDTTFAAAVFEQLVHVARTGSAVTETELNYMLSIVRGLAPTDPTEALLAAQMAAVHNASMVAARRLAHAETIAQQDSHATMLNKLTRTFAAQVEALKRYRTGGEQTIKVQHVTVNDGGRAIVGNVQHPGGTIKSERQSHELVPPHAPGPALLGPVQAHGQPLPSPSREGKTRVPLPRGPRRRAKGPSQRRLPARAPHA